MTGECQRGRIHPQTHLHFVVATRHVTLHIKLGELQCNCLAGFGVNREATVGVIRIFVGVVRRVEESCARRESVATSYTLFEMILYRS